MTHAKSNKASEKNRSTVDAIFVIRQIAEKAIEYNKTAYMCFIDLTKAFDRVRLPDVVKLLKKKNVHPDIPSIITELNTNNWTQIQVEGRKTRRLPMQTGIRQGDSLSPILFNLIMDELITEVKKVGKGYSLGDKELKIICYADDAVLVSEDEDNLQRMLYQFEKTATKYNMEISVAKSKVLTISKEPRRCKLAIYNEPVEQVMSFKYLGVNITSSRNLQEEVKAQTTKAALISGYLRDIIWRNKYMSIESKVRIYKTCVRPVMTYAVETRAENSTTKRITRTAEMRVLRSIAGYTLRDHQRNEDIRERCNVQDIVRWSRSRRREWRDHVERMDDNRLPKIARDGLPRSTRPPGRPPKRWYDSWNSSSQQQL